MSGEVPAPGRRRQTGALLAAFTALLLTIYYIEEARLLQGNTQRPIKHEVRQENFLVKGKKCQIQDYDPYDDEVSDTKF